MYYFVKHAMKEGNCNTSSYKERPERYKNIENADANINKSHGGYYKSL